MRKVMILMATAALVLVVTGCGKDDGASTTAGSASGSGSGVESGGEAGGGAAPVKLTGTVNDHGTKKASAEMKLELDDNYFNPTYIQGQPGEKITIEVENEGSTTHTFTSPALGVDEQVAAGKSVNVEVTLPEKDATPFFCSIHKALGMQGAFFFEKGDKITESSGTTATTGPGY